MKLYLSNNEYIDTEKPLDISIPISNNENSVRAWYLEKPEITPVRNDFF